MCLSLQAIMGEKEVFSTLLAIDVGNTCIVMGYFDQGVLKRTLSLHYDKAMAPGDIASLVKGAVSETPLDAPEVKQVGISNVVKSLDGLFSSVCKELFECAPVFVKHSVKTDLLIDIEHPAELGPDLLACAVGAYRKYRDSLIIIDMGTATKFSLISRHGVFKGVIICPGLKLCADVLKSRISYLPEVPLEMPSVMLGRNTVQSIQSGLMTGHSALIEGMLRKLFRQYEKPAKTILCGGFSPLMKGNIEGIDVVEPQLILDGIRIICQEN